MGIKMRDGRGMEWVSQREFGCSPPKSGTSRSITCKTSSFLILTYGNSPFLVGKIISICSYGPFLSVYTIAILDNQRVRVHFE